MSHPQATPTVLRTSARLLLLLALFALPATATAQSTAVTRVAHEPLRDRHLLIPVQGMSAGQLRDTYSQARSGGRAHDAIDIHAPRGTPVVAVTGGVIRKLHSGALGGLSLYQMDDDGTTRYYYAHLDRYADGMTEGRRVRRGEVIGYVGDSGNAQPGDCHLHFSIAILDNPSRWWEGRNVNPYDVLADGRATRLAGTAGIRD
ncbi:MAG TPA: M23 family metallopeptidase [Longimicrobium sp.]|nr:M23 family metallopeptidase [Longimicrobium sp.]